jgi:hypothetical protein
MKPRRRSLKADAVVPEGAGEPLPARPARVQVTEDDLAAASDLWDSEMPEAEGLLDADQVD